MNKIISIIICAMCISSSITAEYISIVKDQENAKVYLDGQWMPEGSLTNILVNPGGHHIKIILDEEVIYSKTIQVQPGIDQVINTGRFVDLPQSSKIANIGPSIIEANRIKKSKGNIAFGGHFSSHISGVSLKAFPIGPVGVQVIGWDGEWDKKKNQAVEGRIIFNLKDKLPVADCLTSLYAGVGYGKKNTKDLGLNNSYALSDTKTEATDTLKLIVGMEFPVAIGYGFVEIDWHTDQISKTTWDSNNTNIDTSGMGIAAGFHMYF